jgi:hypothetical protein
VTPDRCVSQYPVGHSWFPVADYTCAIEGRDSG